MSRAPVLLTLLLFTGCVPVAEPVSDISKAAPDKDLIGSWSIKLGGEKTVMKIEAAPEVKDNPKGLMRMNHSEAKKLYESKKDIPIWFFVSTVGKEKYGNICLEAGRRKDLVDFESEGDYDEWAKSRERAYMVFRYEVTRDELVLNLGNENAFQALMEKEKFDLKKGPQGLFGRVFKTPEGWLAKYLEKNGSAELFPANTEAKYKKVK